MREKIKKQFKYYFLGLLFLTAVFVWYAVFKEGRSGLEVDFLDVGQGDAILIKTPDHQRILIDGGPSTAVLNKLGENLPFFDKEIDLVILTHPEKDHLFGLLEVLKRYKIKNILWTGVVRDTAEWEEWSKLIKEENANIRIAEAGEQVILKKNSQPIFIDILYPEENLEGEISEDSNDTSIVGRLVFAKNSFLFTGDINRGAEEKLLQEREKGILLNSNVLKIAHHGSNTSSSEQFLEKVSPLIAVIPVGENSYGHPTEELLARLNNFGIEILRTDKDGDIKFISDGNNIKVYKNNKSN